MGRPLAKRFFGNRNLGSGSTTNDDGIGGSRVASVTVTAAGNYAPGTARPTVSFSTPDLSGVGAVQAAGTVSYRARTLTAAVSGTQTKAYQVGQVLTMSITGTAYGTTATVATLAGTSTINADSIIADGTITIAAAGTATLLQGTSITFPADAAGVGGTPLAGNTYFVLASVTASNTFRITTSYANAIAGTGATFTAGDIDDSIPNGYAAVTAGSTAGAAATVSTTPTAKGSYTLATLPAAAQDTATTGGGVGATVAVATYEVDAVTMTEKGSGYSTVADAAPTFSAGTSTATGASVLEADGTGIYVLGTNENAITISAYLPTTAATGLISGAGGVAAKNGDIQAQHGSRRYIVETADGVGIVKLVAAAPAAGEATIIATDSDNNEYYVIKLTRHRATLVQKTLVGAAYQFASNDSTGWTFDSATVNETVKVANS